MREWLAALCAVTTFTRINFRRIIITIALPLVPELLRYIIVHQPMSVS